LVAVQIPSDEGVGKHLEEGKMDRRRIGMLGAIFALLAVALGAFGAHGLRAVLSSGELATFETGVRYQMYHALALLLVAARHQGGGSVLGRVAGWAFTVGILLFSGSLYTLVLAGLPWMGAVTPLGGVAFLVGWIALAWGFFKEGE
jgi:uncharacterized membrane protein YgdD (TMEM256/DUF423 family)